MCFLLDVNLLVALIIPSDPAHQKAQSWFKREANRQWATCALTQAGFLRVASHMFGRTRDSMRTALANLETNCRSGTHTFWPVDVDLRDLTDSQRSRLIGRNQIADMQLLLLAHSHRAQLVTFDTGIRELASGTHYVDSLLIL